MARRNPLHEVAIVGAYNTRQARVIEQPETAVLLDAMRGALRSAGLSFPDVDGVNVTSSVRRWNPREVVQLLGGAPRWTGMGLGIEGVLEAAGAIATGQCETVLLVDAQAGLYTERAATSPWTRPANEFVACFGLYTAAEFALIARRHMHLYGTRPEALAEVAATIRSHGALNPEAVHYGRTRDAGRRAGLAMGGGALPPARLRDQFRGRRGTPAHLGASARAISMRHRSSCSAAHSTARAWPT
jgi:acetyl-CoA acetyltransferase